MRDQDTCPEWVRDQDTCPEWVRDQDTCPEKMRDQDTCPERVSVEFEFSHSTQGISLGGGGEKEIFGYKGGDM